MASRINETMQRIRQVGLIAIIRGAEKRYIGHNPAGSVMLIVLLLAVSATALAGYLMTTDDVA